MGLHVCVQFLVSVSQGKVLREQNQPWSSGPARSAPLPAHPTELQTGRFKKKSLCIVPPPRVLWRVSEVWSGLRMWAPGTKNAGGGQRWPVFSRLPFCPASPQIPLGCIYKGEGVSRMKSSSEVISNLKLIKCVWIHSLPLESNCVQDVLL